MVKAAQPDRGRVVEVLSTVDARLALARRDIATVFRLLTEAGITQRQIAALTGQHPAEVSHIARGRIVRSYDVLARIANGLGVPPGWMGLSHDDETTGLILIATLGDG